MLNLQESPICVSSGEDADDDVFETIHFKFNDDKVTYHMTIKKWVWSTDKINKNQP